MLQQRKVRPIWPLGRRILTNKSPKSLVKNGRFQVHGRFLPLTKGPKKYHPLFCDPNNHRFYGPSFHCNIWMSFSSPFGFSGVPTWKGPSCWTYHSPSFTWNLKVTGFSKRNLLGTIFRWVSCEKLWFRRGWDKIMIPQVSDVGLVGFPRKWPR